MSTLIPNQSIDGEPLQDSIRTCISRVTFTQEIRIVLPPAAFWRRVQVLVPSDMTVQCDEDRDSKPSVEGYATKGLAGHNRVYKLPEFPPAAQIEFRLAPGQWLVGAVGAHETGIAHVTFIVEPTQGVA